jgi:hypothetical protein
MMQYVGVRSACDRDGFQGERMFVAGRLRILVCACALAAHGRAACAREASAPRPSAKAAEPAPGDSSRQTRDEAARSLPRKKLNREALAQVESVLESVTIFRRLPTQTIECDPNYYLFLVEHPDVVVGLWRTMGVSEMTLAQDEHGKLAANDAAGTKAHVEFLYSSPELQLLLADGEYHGALFTRPVRGRCLLVLRTKFSRDASGKRFATCRLDAFLQVKHVGANLLARTFQTFVGQTADHNFRETTLFLEKLNAAAASNHVAVQRLGDKIDTIDEERRQEFASLSEQVAIRTALARSHPSSMARAPTAPRPAPRLSPPTAASKPPSLKAGQSKARGAKSPARAANSPAAKTSSRRRSAAAQGKPGVIIAKGKGSK